MTERFTIPPRDTTEEIIKVVAEELPTAIKRAGLSADTCILHTRSSLFVFEALGIAAYALPVQVLAMNAAFYARALVDGELRGPTSPEDAKTWGLRGERMLQIGDTGDRGRTSSGREGYDGHLVTVVQDRWLLDASLGAWDRPEKGIRLDSLYCEARPFIMEEVGGAGFFLPEGGYLLYSGLSNLSYLRAPDWLGLRRDDPWVLETLAKIPGQKVPSAVLQSPEARRASRGPGAP